MAAPEVGALVAWCEGHGSAEAQPRDQPVGEINEFGMAFERVDLVAETAQRHDLPSASRRAQDDGGVAVEVLLEDLLFPRPESPFVVVGALVLRLAIIERLVHGIPTAIGEQGEP
jgi:hypothetical protein